MLPADASSCYSSLAGLPSVAEGVLAEAGAVRLSPGKAGLSLAADSCPAVWAGSGGDDGSGQYSRNRSLLYFRLPGQSTICGPLHLDRCVAGVASFNCRDAVGVKLQ